MAFQTGVPANTQGLIDTLIAFAVAEGGFTLGNTWSYAAANAWTMAAGTGLNVTARALLRGGEYVYLAWPTSAPNRISLNTGTNNPSANNIASQTACATGSLVVELGTAPLRYWMFSDGSAVNCVVEWVGGAFQHINFGYLQKYGSFTGGLYVTGSVNNRQYAPSSAYQPINSTFLSRPFDGWNTSNAEAYGGYGHVRATYNGLTTHRFGNNVTVAQGFTLSLPLAGSLFSSATSTTSWLIHRSPNSYNGRAVLLPIEIALGQTVANAPASWIPVGRVNNAAHINIANLNPGDTILTDWMVFPWSAKNSGGFSAGYINSLNYGMAYRK